MATGNKFSDFSNNTAYPPKPAPTGGESDVDLESWKPAWRFERLFIRSTKTSKFLRWATTLAASAAFIALLIFRSTSSAMLSPTKDSSLQMITNSTLGFHKIYSISLPNHWHKHDAQLLAARYTGFDIENIQGVMWDQVPKTEYPVGWHDPYYASIGCWRAHLNVLSRIVETGVGSALM